MSVQRKSHMVRLSDVILMSNASWVKTLNLANGVCLVKQTPSADEDYEMQTHLKLFVLFIHTFT